MKFSAIMTPARLLRKPDAAAYVGGEHVLDLFESAGWVTPAKQGHRCTVYDRLKLDTACDRLSSGELLEPRK